jgi:hypothetical protein
MFGNASAFSALGRYNEAAGWTRKMLALQPNDVRGLFSLTGNAYLSDQLAEACGLMKEHYPNLRSSDLRRAFWVRRPADREIVERTIAFIGLPE